MCIRDSWQNLKVWNSTILNYIFTTLPFKEVLKEVSSSKVLKETELNNRFRKITYSTEWNRILKICSICYKKNKKKVSTGSRECNIFNKTIDFYFIDIKLNGVLGLQYFLNITSLAHIPLQIRGRSSTAKGHTARWGS